MAVDTCVEIFCGAKMLLITVLFLSITEQSMQIGVTNPVHGFNKHIQDDFSVRLQ